jgi:hypothetical protein
MAAEWVLKLLAKHRRQCSTNFATRCGGPCRNAIDGGRRSVRLKTNRSELIQSRRDYSNSQSGNSPICRELLKRGKPNQECCSLARYKGNALVCLQSLREAICASAKNLAANEWLATWEGSRALFRTLQFPNERLQPFPVFHRGAVGELYPQTAGIAPPYNAPNIRMNIANVKSHPNPRMVWDLPRGFQVTSA